MDYIVLVTGPPYGTQNSTTAFLFSRTLISSKHRLLSVFFYCEGVCNANRFISPDFSECNLVEKWGELHKKYSIKLCVCVSAALRRGIIDTTAVNVEENMNIKDSNLESSFCLTGLSDFSDYLEISDRVIQF